MCARQVGLSEMCARQPLLWQRQVNVPRPASSQPARGIRACHTELVPGSTRGRHMRCAAAATTLADIHAHYALRLWVIFCVSCESCARHAALHAGTTACSAVESAACRAAVQQTGLWQTTPWHAGRDADAHYQLSCRGVCPGPLPMPCYKAAPAAQARHTGQGN